MKQQNKLWLLMGKQLSSGLSDSEITELEDLLAENPELWYSYELLQSIISLDDVPESFIQEFKSLLDKKGGVDEVNLLLQSQLNQEVNVQTGDRYKRMITYASAALITGVLLWFGVSFVKNTEIKQEDSVAMNEIVAPKGSKTKIILVDGTSIWLNAGSRLKYPKNFSMENREVYLVGEGYFEVIHNDQYSFVVHTTNADIVDLGTTFNVKAYEESSTTETTLIEGSLEVVLKDKTAKRILIKPNEKVVLQNKLLKDLKSKDINLEKTFEVTTVVPYVKTNDIVETAWIADKLIFRDQKFQDLALEMERKFNVKIYIKDKKINNYYLTGIFYNENIVEALKLLQFIAPFKYKIQNNEVTIEN